ncbi:hypothetical protein DSL72_006757 [Monilinia vaccinii-corymbosi]|uniref:Carboxylic ester hydrolase n=1 Tax=Monilinia vaccinii-corymbosi TaxID=61207 RepID=A0A8A3PPP2_9HELO|nr:hypothetical protein DSL72_006757 [Monilinia vaccinii-corymbosi]
MFVPLHHLMLTIVAVSLVHAAVLPQNVTNSTSATVTVNLGYVVQSATTVVASNGTSFLNFSNVRYAAAPTGRARFAPPSSPAPTPVPNYTEADIPPTDPRTSEDCLFLDVLVPKDTFQKGAKAKAAVLVYIHGGGYFKGHKSDFGDGLGLVTTSKAKGGPGGTSNAGLLDQRFALQWVKKYIGLFGGDPNRITVMGESAGAGSIMAHTVSNGGAPFDQGMTQSPYLVEMNAATQEETYQAVLNSTGTKSLSTLLAMKTPRLHSS